MSQTERSLFRFIPPFSVDFCYSNRLGFMKPAGKYGLLNAYRIQRPRDDRP